MPRRHFQADLAKAVEGVTIAGISDVQPGGDDGEFTFNLLADGQQLSVSVLIPELSYYPASHDCIIFGADNASASVAAALNDIAGAAAGKTINQILAIVSSRLQSTDRDGDEQMLDSDALGDLSDSDGETDDYFPGDEDLDPRPRSSMDLPSTVGGGHTKATLVFRQRIRDDLGTAKNQGFRVGYLGELIDGQPCHVSLSIRLSKLGLSNEAMQAWQLEPLEYLVAIMHYPNGYKSMDDLKSYDAIQARRSFQVRLGISTVYKPTIQEAVQCFNVLSREQGTLPEEPRPNDPHHATPPRGFRDSFISRPLNELLEQRLYKLIKYRYDGMSWNGAELFYNHQVHTASDASQDASHNVYYMEDHVSNVWPKVVTSDHIKSAFGQQHSLPVVAMQFVLRHFVRCTEFCLICFRKMPDDLQAIRPYVCDNPLCLYQYMTLGLGPSIEHEVLSQPKVVDLLISFCYSSARFARLNDFPDGLGLLVPPSVAFEDRYTKILYYQPHTHTRPQIIATPRIDHSQLAISSRYSNQLHELSFQDCTKPCPVENGQWILLRLDDFPMTVLHCRVVDVSYYPSVQVSEAVRPANEAHSDAAAPQDPVALGTGFRSASLHIYNENFDNLSDAEKRQAIPSLLDLLPPIREMKKYVRKTKAPLSLWVNRFPPAALCVLRWIIASNRSCILQVERSEDNTSARKAQDRLYGMPGYTQFRFAMGAPDKERRFVQAVREATERLSLKYPTLFAWHGSPLHNWHTIIREGLHFKQSLHGRVYGNGVYHALNVNISVTYAQMGNHCAWSPSDLGIQQVVALNEIVNAPAEYESRSPHLVVAQLDWIQTRYLFVKTRADASSIPTARFTQPPESPPLESLEQDPSWTPRGLSEPLIIPVHAMAVSRQSRSIPTRQHKRQKISGKTRYDQIGVEDDNPVSDATDEEDLDIFDTDLVPQQIGDSLPTPNSVTGGKGKGKLSSLTTYGNRLVGSKTSISSQPLTDYVPGTLDYSTLPVLKMPSWASTSATRRLMRDFKDLILVQNKGPLHELGWHIDEDKIENMYQWIVELHSFDATLPLAKDMKAKDIKSVVLEMRFGKDYPMGPPFVRVIRPRFLGFLQGGGGHVTSGGAMCMELLTNDGWSAVSSIESVLLQVRMAISSRDPNPARLVPGEPMDYKVGEAVEAYMRACTAHGWTIPPGFREMALGGSDGPASA